MKSVVLSLMLAVMLAFSAAADEAGARQFTQGTADEAIEILQSERDETGKRRALEALFTDSVNTDWIGRFVIGRHWRSLEEAEQNDYLSAYREFLVKHYTSNFREYSKGTTYEISESREIKKGQYMVQMDIIRPSNPQPIQVKYRIREKNGDYQIIDIVVEGISLLNTQRSEFAAVIQKDGIQKLIEQLKAKS